MIAKQQYAQYQKRLMAYYNPDAILAVISMGWVVSNLLISHWFLNEIIEGHAYMKLKALQFRNM